MKIFVLYRDLVVREYTDLNSEYLVDSIGIIEGKPSNRTFFPAFFAHSKKGKGIELWDWVIHNGSIQLTPFFQLKKISEKEDSNLGRRYYKEVSIELTDNFEFNISFDYQMDPEKSLSYEFLQSKIALIVNEIGKSESVKMLKVLQELKSYSEKVALLENTLQETKDELNSIKKENIELVKTIKDLKGD